MQNKIEYLLLKFLSFLISKLNIKTSQKLARVLAFIFYYVIPLRKNVVIKNLRIAFPDIQENELKRYIRKAYENLFLVLVEILLLPYLSKDKIYEMVEIENVKLIDEALSHEKGLIFVSAHFGNWEILALASALKLKKPFMIVTKPLRNNLVDQYINDWRCKYGNSIIPLNKSVKNIFKALIDKKIIALLADQRASATSLQLKFFDKLTHVYEGPATLSVKTGAPLILGMAIRQDFLKYKVELTPIPIPDDKNDNEKIISMTENYISLLENYIRKYPDHWLWFHNRWRH